MINVRSLKSIKVDACVGDSGGPLDCYDKKRKRQTLNGIVSFGKNCASETYAGVYVNVPFYGAWIRSTILEYGNGKLPEPNADVSQHDDYMSYWRKRNPTTYG